MNDSQKRAKRAQEIKAYAGAQAFPTHRDAGDDGQDLFDYYVCHAPPMPMEWAMMMAGGHMPAPEAILQLAGKWAVDWASTAVQAAIAFRKSIDQACNPVAAATEAEVPMAAEAAKPSIKLVEP